MIHELDQHAKYRRAAARATSIRAEQDAAAALRETAARLKPVAPATTAAAISPALAAAPPRSASTTMTKTPPASTLKVSATGRAVGLPRADAERLAAATEQWRAGELFAVLGVQSADAAGGRWVVLERDAAGKVAVFDHIRD